MVDCHFCGGKITDSLPTVGIYHLECEREEYNRMREGRCTRCGADGTVWMHMCGSCTPESPYVDYPPEAA